MPVVAPLQQAPEGTSAWDQTRQPSMSVSTRWDGAPAQPTGAESSFRTGSGEGRGEDLAQRGQVVLALTYFVLLACYFLLFTELGFGATVYKGLAIASPLAASLCAAGGLSMLLVLYLSDVAVTTPAGKVLATLGAIGMLLSAILLFRSMPFMPFMVYFVLMASCNIAIYFMFFNQTQQGTHVSIKSYLMAMGKMMALGGLVALLVSLIFTGASPVQNSGGWWWNSNVKRAFHDRLRVCEDMAISGKVGADGACPGRHCCRYGQYGVTCPAGRYCQEKQESSACPVNMTHIQLYDSEKDPACMAAWILWSGPYLVSIFSIVFGAFFYYIARSAVERRRSAGMQNAILSQEAKMFVYFMLSMTALAYGGTLIAASDMQLYKLVMALAGLGWVLGAAALGFSLGRKDLEKVIREQESLKSIRESEWWMTTFKAVAILVALPFFCVLLVVAWVKRTIHKSDRQLTAFMLLNLSQTWDKGAVLARIVFMGTLYFSMNVVAAQFMTLFCAWLNVALAAVNIVLICFIIIFVGLLLFAVPIIPGVPIYYLTGVICAGQIKQLNESMAIAVVVGTIVSIVTKLLACAMQQKLFGEMLGGRVSIRTACAINSESMKAINLILTEPGISFTAVCIFMGGPDWPTSVLCGILKVPLQKNLMGTSPMLVPILFCVLTGASWVKRDLDYANGNMDSMWEGLASVFGPVSVGIMTVTMFLAIGRTNAFISEKHEEINKVPNDTEVEEYERKQVRQNESQRQALQWETLPPLWRGVLATAAGLNMLSFWIFFYLNALGWESSQCFEVIKITTDPFGEPLHGRLYGNWGQAGFIRPAGLAGIVIQLVSWIVYAVFAHRLEADTAEIMRQSSHIPQAEVGVSPADLQMNLPPQSPQSRPPALIRSATIQLPAGMQPTPEHFQTSFSPQALAHGNYADSYPDHHGRHDFVEDRGSHLRATQSSRPVCDQQMTHVLSTHPVLHQVP